MLAQHVFQLRWDALEQCGQLMQPCPQHQKTLYATALYQKTVLQRGISQDITMAAAGINVMAGSCKWFI